MSKIPVRIHRISEASRLPTQANEGDAGWDVYASEDVFFEPGQIKLVPLGIIAEAPYGYHFKLCIRSSVAYKKSFTQPNSPGIIDHLYRGPNDEIKLMLKAPSHHIKVTVGDRIGQLILEKNNDIEWAVQKDADFAGESRGGFGSSGN